MKLVLATPLYPPEMGGPATYAEMLVRGLPKKNTEVTLVLFRDVRKYPKVVRHIVYFFNVLRATHSADMVLALDPVSVGFPAALAAAFAGKPFAVKIVGDFAWEQGTQRFGITISLNEFVLPGRVPLAVSFLRMIQSFVAHRAKIIIVPSEYLKSIVMKWGIKSEKIKVIYNSIDLPEFSSDAVRNETLVLSAGRLVPWKGMRGVIEAVAEVRKDIDAASLLIIGDGPEKSSLQKLGSELLGEHVSFGGPRTHEETLQALRSTGIFVLNSSYEGLSHILIEALMLGCAIVTTDAGGNPELIKNEENGLVVPVGDTLALSKAVTRILQDETLREKLRANAKNSASRFSSTRMIEETSRTLHSVVETI